MMPNLLKEIRLRDAQWDSRFEAVETIDEDAEWDDRWVALRDRRDLLAYASQLESVLVELEDAAGVSADSRVSAARRIAREVLDRG